MKAIASQLCTWLLHPLWQYSPASQPNSTISVRGFWFARVRVLHPAACLATALLWWAGTTRLPAQAGSLDTTFNPGTGTDGTVRAAVVQPDGKIIIGGDFGYINGVSHQRVARLNADGSLDAGFTAGGEGAILALALQPDGKILLGGGGSFLSLNGVSVQSIARLNADGTLDAGFNQGAGANASVYAIAVQPDGKIILAGAFTTIRGVTRNRLSRLNPDGSLDTTFAPNGGADDLIYDVALQPDGGMIIGGRFLNYNGEARTRIARVHSNGSLDHSFNPGTGTDDSVESIAIQTDGGIVFGGSFGHYNGMLRSCLARVDAAGTLDNIRVYWG